MLPRNVSSSISYMVEEAMAYVQAARLKAMAAFLDRLYHSPITMGDEMVKELQAAIKALEKHQTECAGYTDHAVADAILRLQIVLKMVEAGKDLASPE